MSDGFRNQTEHLTLDLSSRQVTGTIIGALVSLAAAFALGVSVGHRVGAAPAPADAAPSLDALDRPAPPPAPAMAFHEALRNDDGGHPAPRAAAIAPSPGTVKPEPVEAPVPAPAPEPAKAEVAPEPPKPVVARAEPKPAPEPEAAPSLAASAGDDLDETWTVQFASSPARAEADRMAATLGEKGYSARVVVADIAGKGRYYRVRVGRFASRETADNLRREAAAKTGVSGVVMRSQ